MATGCVPRTSVNPRRRGLGAPPRTHDASPPRALLLRPMAYALMSSGGKDSTLALARARRTGLDVRFLANIYDGSGGRVRFHGVRHELIEAQAASLRLECVQASAQPEGVEDVFLRVLDDLKARGCQGMVFGNIHLEAVRGG